MKRPAIILAALLCMASRHPDRMVRSDLALNVSFNRGDATTRSMVTHAPTLNNGAVITAGNRFLTLDGVNDFLSYPDHDSFSFTNGSGQDQPFTVSAWVYLDASANAYKTIMAKSEATSPARMEWVFFASADASTYKGPAFGFYNADASITTFAAINSNVIPAATWTHVCATSNGSELSSGIKVYVNAVELADVRRDGVGYAGMSNTSAKLTVGCRELSGLYLGGRIDDARIYNRELSAAEVQSIFSAGRDP